MNKLLNKTHIHPTFFLFFLYFIFTNKLPFFILFFVVVLSHEFGHYFVAKRCGYVLNSFYLAPYGACLNYKEKVFDSRDEILVALAGPAVNFLLSVIIVSLWWVVPEIYNFTNEVAQQSLMLGLFNLLPCYPLDGGRVAVGYLSLSIGREKAIKIISIFNYIFSFILLVLFVYSCFTNFNPTFALAGIFLFLGVFEWGSEGKYQLKLTKKRAKNFSKPLFLFVDENVTLKTLLRHVEVNKFTIFVVRYCNGKTRLVDEVLLEKLVLCHSVGASLKDIFTQGKA